MPRGPILRWQLCFWFDGFYEGNEPSSTCNQKRIQLVENQYAPKSIYDYIIRKGNDASGVNQEEGVEIATA